jgi:4-carboxymuconolactone decarboxylase
MADRAAGADYRLVPVTEDNLTSAQRPVWDGLAGGKRGGKSIRAEGFLVGPFDALVRSPGVAEAGGRLGEVLRFETELTQRERELAIITVVAHWRSTAAWPPHAAYAEEAGVPAEAVAAIGAGREPAFDSHADRVIYQLVSELVSHGRVSDENYGAAHDLLGERRLVELVALSGYYCFTSFVLDAFQVPIPVGTTVPWTHKEGVVRG